MRTFNEFWELLSPKAEYANRRKACYDMWNRLAENQQDTLYNRISEKLANRKYVDFNPLFAMRNNSEKLASPSGTPTNYNGRALPTDQPVVTARYDNRWGTYTVQEARTFRMTIRIPESIFLHGKALYDAQNHGEHLVQVARPESNERYVYEEAKPDPRRIYMCTKSDADLYELRVITDPRKPIRLDE